tara:strand:- start:58610 stop:59944 length:1335 start_codon:yes stop_codon:yes gene_type:complete
MSHVIFNNLRVNAAEQFKEQISEPTPNTQLYLTYGRTVEWPDETTPPTANTSGTTTNEIWQYMIGAKRILGNDMAFAIPRHTWTANTKYIAYDDRNTDLYNTAMPFYCVTSNFDVYKCLANNASANSTVEPTAISTSSATQTSDGYVWKFMYNVSRGDRLRFLTDEYITVKTLSVDDGTTQWTVQNTATSGAIHSIQLIDSGSGYINTDNIVVAVTGDGTTTATATANINLDSGIVNSITITAPGTEYSTASVAITGGKGANGNTATAHAIIAPFGGHGSDPLYELGGSNIIASPRLIGTEEGVFSVGNDYRQIAIIQDPFLIDTTTVASASAILQAKTVTTTGLGDYDVDEIVYQGGTVATATYTGTVYNWNVTTGIATVINTTGTPTTGALIGANTITTRFVTSTSDPGLQIGSGKIIFMDNLKAITRSADQTENFKIVIKF